MFKLLVVHIILVYAGQSQITVSRPLYEEFLTTFLNASMKKIGKFSNNCVDVKVSPNDVQFLLFEAGSANPRVIDQNKPNLLDPGKDIKIIIHGWTDNARLPWIENMIKTYFNTNKNNFYILSIDWRNIANLSYPTSATAVQSVGYISGDILWKQIGENRSRLENIHVIGHSLGAHVAGFLGQRIRKISGAKINRISGLDAANPLFMFKTKNLRLSRDDADFVDSYHTDSGFRGQSRPLGHVDFYFNCDSLTQPSCRNQSAHINQLSSCNHQTVHTFFIKTISNPRLFLAEFCPIVVTLLNISGINRMRSRSEKIYAGEYVDQRSFGTYCVSTSGYKPAKMCRFIV